MNKKKILFLVNDLSFFISHRNDIALAALNSGYKVSVAYGELGNISKNKISKFKFRCFKVPLYPAGINPLKELYTIIFLWLLFKKKKPDLVHLITIKPYLYGGIAANLAGIKCVVSTIAGLGILLKKNFIIKIFRKVMFPLFWFAFHHKNQRVIVQNINDKKILTKWGVVRKNKISIFPGSGVNLKKFTNLNEKWSNNETNVIFASRLLKDKGVYDFVSASKILNDRGVKANFHIAGNIDLKNPTSLNTKELKNLKKYKFLKILGFKKNIPDLYSKSHIVCFPSYYGEGIPKTLIEAAAAGRAIITTDHPGCRDAIVKNKSGLLAPIKNPKILADLIEHLIANPKQRIKMGKFGRRFAEKKFDVNKIIKKHINVYKLLIRK